ncbi:tail fiber domain-containing protein [Roseomonas chloroacetimidivorans]|uniref:tail fiber domain-containing protein n=1 Tax=Roseomonas chloroacetimidivorans TaxID=1766656 RepID=UPI003C78BD82
MGDPVFTADRVLAITNTTGTGAYALAAAASGTFRTIGQAGGVAGRRYMYTVQDSISAPTEFEEGEGIFGAGPPETLSRSTIKASSNGGSAVNWSAGTKYLFLTVHADRQVLRDTDGIVSSEESFRTSRSFAANYPDGYGFIQLGSVLQPDGYYASMGISMNAGGYEGFLRTLHKPSVEAIVQLLIGSPFSFYNSGSAVANGSWISGSDGRVKVEREVITDALAKVRELTGFTYTRADMGGRRDVGVIAQDVRRVLPEAVFANMAPPASDPNGEPFLGLNYNALIALLIEATKALAARLEALETRSGA